MADNPLPLLMMLDEAGNTWAEYGERVVFEQILDEYPDLERADIQQALEYAAAATDVHLHRLRSPA